MPSPQRLGLQGLISTFASSIIYNINTLCINNHFAVIVFTDPFRNKVKCVVCFETLYDAADCHPLAAQQSGRAASRTVSVYFCYQAHEEQVRRPDPADSMIRQSISDLKGCWGKGRLRDLFGYTCQSSLRPPEVTASR